MMPGTREGPGLGLLGAGVYVMLGACQSTCHTRDLLEAAPRPVLYSCMYQAQPERATETVYEAPLKLPSTLA